MAGRADELRAELKQEQSRGLFQIGQFYEKRRNYTAARIYYNEVIEQNPRSDWANTAQRKLTALAARHAKIPRSGKPSQRSGSAEYISIVTRASCGETDL